jgi:hypothetical protein
MFWSDADHSHHPTGFAKFRAVREEACSVARGTSSHDANLLLAHSSVFELTFVGFHQIQVNFWSEVAVAWGALIEKQQWVAHVDGVRVKNLFE